ncbi:PREDICTED: uncharacterized protein LOC108768583 [Trachymyrmex cornetzi]|uniref:uncharacterized protein LOC108768583 n=1 Tax=Trachymyrmex cornetzi TaxID=471704 RepID=UPI00084EF070|nr:PREDICTED: uncharacterized protein LOC108768583 [Trachymyrmex cornetzi]
MVLAFWKRRCSMCKQCCSSNVTELILRKANESNVLETQIMKHDVTTSLSDIRIPRELEGVATPDHCYRKVGYSRRREYIDCPTCVPSLYKLGVAQIQTESKKMSVVESQTARAITKETPMQTLSKCEFCRQHIQLPITVGADVPSTHCFQHPQWSYPAIVQFLRGEVSAPCCTGCKCTADTAQTQQQSQQLKHTRSLMSKVKSNPHKMTSETTQQLTNIESRSNITKMTTTQPTPTYIASFYGPDKKMQTTPDIDYKRKVAATEIKKDIREDIDQKIMEKTKIKLAKTKESDIIEKIIVEHENVKERNKDSMEVSKEKIIGENKIERSKGGGEHSSDRIDQEFRGVMEQESITNLKESSMHTSRMLSTPLSSRTKPRTLLQLKSNKVDPITDANIFVTNEDCIPERMASRTILDNQNIQGSEHSARIGTPNPTIERQLNAACSLYRQQKSLTPTSDNSRYNIVFKDRKGRYFCEFCAPLESSKITSRFEGTESRKLRCTSCRLHFRDRGIRTRSDTCPKYSRKHMTSPSTT